MKKHFKLLSILLVFVLVFVGCSSKDNAKTDDSKAKTGEEKKTEEKKEDSAKKEESGKVDTAFVSKYFKDLYENPENKPYTYRLSGKDSKGQVNESEVAFDGKVLVQKTKINGQLMSDIYKTVEDGQTAVYSGVVDQNGKINYYRSIEESKNGKLNIDLIRYLNLQGSNWKEDKKDGNIQTFVAHLDENAIKEFNKANGAELNDVKGDMTYIAEFDTVKKQVVKVQLKPNYTAKVKYKIGVGADAKEDVMEITAKGQSEFKEFKFDNVAEVKIPQEAIDAAKKQIK